METVAGTVPRAYCINLAPRNPPGPRSLLCVTSSCTMLPVARAHMLVGGIVEAGAGRAGAVVAFVAVSLGIEGSRMFKVHGPADSPGVDELPAATTVDLGRFRRELETELQAEIDAVAALGGAAAISQPQAGWVCAQVARHLQQSEGLAIE